MPPGKTTSNPMTPVKEPSERALRRRLDFVLNDDEECVAWQSSASLRFGAPPCPEEVPGTTASAPAAPCPGQLWCWESMPPPRGASSSAPIMIRYALINTPDEA